jgi:hypothetical protein
VLGKSSLDNTQILVIDFGEKLREKMDDPESNMLIDVTLVAVGHAYLDMVSGFPIELKVSVEMTGKFSAGIDRYVFDVGYVMRK